MGVAQPLNERINRRQRRRESLPFLSDNIAAEDAVYKFILALTVYRLCETLILCILYMQTISLHVSVQKVLPRDEEQGSEQLPLHEFVRNASAGKGDAYV